MVLIRYIPTRSGSPRGSNASTTAIAFKIHHALCDGYSILHILDKLSKTTSPYIVKDYQDGVCTQLKQFLEAPMNLSRMNGVPPERNIFRVNLPSPPERSYDWMFSFTSLPLEDLKLLRRKNGRVHMTAVIWTVVSGALRRFLLEEQVEIPEYIKVGNTIPVPRHPAMSNETKNKDKMCNHWVSAILQVPIREPDPLIRLNQIEKDLVSFLATGLDKFAKRVVLPLIWTMPGALLEKSLGSKDMGIGGGLTSLIGSDNYSLLGFPINHIHPILAVHDNNPFFPMACFTFTHSGKMELTIGANPRSIFRNKQTLDKICHTFCFDELQSFLHATNTNNSVQSENN